MNKLLACSVFFLVGCMPFVDISAYTIPEFHSPLEVAEWVGNTITYTLDSPESWLDLDRDEDWSLPWVTLERGTGDCEDMSSLMAWIVEGQLGQNADLVLVTNPSSNHMLVEVSGVLYDPQSGYPDPAFAWVEYDRMTLDEYIFHAEVNPFRSVGTDE